MAKKIRLPTDEEIEAVDSAELEEGLREIRAGERLVLDAYRQRMAGELWAEFCERWSLLKRPARGHKRASNAHLAAAEIDVNPRELYASLKAGKPTERVVVGMLGLETILDWSLSAAEAHFAIVARAREWWAANPAPQAAFGKRGELATQLRSQFAERRAAWKAARETAAETKGDGAK